MSTKSRAIDAASTAFARRGFAATSLDELARELGFTKQTILYHFGSKNGLLEAVLVDGADQLIQQLGDAVAAAPAGWPKVEAAVRSAFALAISEPHLLGLLREVSRLGPPQSDVVLELLGPLVDDAVAALDEGMDAGLFRRSDPRIVLVSAYASVTGVVTDAGALTAVGLELDLRVAAQLRRAVLQFLRAALVPAGAYPRPQ